MGGCGEDGGYSEYGCGCKEGSRMIGCVDVRGLVGHEPPALAL